MQMILKLRPFLAYSQSKQGALQSLQVELNPATLMVMTNFYKTLKKNIHFDENIKMLKCKQNAEACVILF